MLLSTVEGVIYTSIAIIASFQWAVTGVGNAIIFLFLYQFIDFTSVFTISTLKYTILIQSTSLFSSIIYILIINFQDIKKYFYWRMVVPLILTESLTAYLGVYVQKQIEIDYLRLIIGSLVLLVVLIKVIHLLILCKVNKEKRISTASTTPSQPSENEVNNENATSEKFPLENSVIFWSSFIGIVGGFLGGLCGAKGPPLVIYFLVTGFHKGVVRTTGILSSFVNVIIRLIIYACTSPPNDSSWPIQENQNTWFIAADWPVYLYVLIGSVLGVTLGTKVHDKVKPGQFDYLLICLLLVCGVAMVSRSIVSFLDSDLDNK